MIKIFLLWLLGIIFVVGLLDLGIKFLKDYRKVLLFERLQLYFIGVVVPIYSFFVLIAVSYWSNGVGIAILYEIVFNAILVFCYCFVAHFVFTFCIHQLCIIRIREMQFKNSMRWKI